MVHYDQDDKEKKLFCFIHLTVAASSSMDSHIRLWDLDNGKQIKSIDSGPGKKLLVASHKESSFESWEKYILGSKRVYKVYFLFFLKLIHGQWVSLQTASS